MIIWLKKDTVLAIHAGQIAEHGGSAGVRDETLLESALARPQQLYAYGEPAADLADLAAALAFGLARNHPFLDATSEPRLCAAKHLSSSMTAGSMPTISSSFNCTSPSPKASSPNVPSPHGCASGCNSTRATKRASNVNRTVRRRAPHAGAQREPVRCADLSRRSHRCAPGTPPAKIEPIIIQ